MSELETFLSKHDRLCGSNDPSLSGKRCDCGRDVAVAELEALTKETIERVCYGILAHVDEITEDESITDGWGAFAKLADFVNDQLKAAQHGVHPTASGVGGLCICGKPFGHHEVCLPENGGG